MMRRAVLLSLIGAIAVAAGVTASANRPQSAQASNPDAEIHVIAISSSICLAFGGALPAPCFDQWRPGSQHALADILTKGLPEAPPRNCPANATGTSNQPSVDRCRLLPSDFASVDGLDGDQLHAEDPGISSAGAGPFDGLFIMAFVPDDGPVEFRTDKGKFVQVDDSPGPFAGTDNVYTCNGQFDDCNGDNVALKGLVVVPLGGYGAELGPGRVTVSQGTKQAALDFTVVGEPNTIKIDTFKSTISNGIKDIEGKTAADPPDKKLSGPDECPLPVTLEGFQNALGRPDKTVLIGRIYDSTGQQITQGWVSWTGTGVNPNDPIGLVANFGAPVTPTVNLGSFGFGAPQVLCGTKGIGTVTVKATINKHTNDDALGAAEKAPLGLLVDPMAHAADPFTLDFNVISQVASVSATADPPVVDCNGTNSAKVSAAVVNAEGQPIADGQSVEFDVVALGIANPIISKTGGGVATTTVTPLSPVDELRGVTVNIKTIPSNSSAESHATSVRVDCSGASVPAAGSAGAGAAAGAAAGRAPAPSGIHGPDTGSAGLLGDARTLSWWPALALVTAAFALAGVRFATKQR